MNPEHIQKTYKILENFIAASIGNIHTRFEEIINKNVGNGRQFYYCHGMTL
jgi:hypothetical protein